MTYGVFGLLVERVPNQGLALDTSTKGLQAGPNC
jgi:hypothetical protein